MSNEDSLYEVKEISYYRNQALSKMNIFNIEKDKFFPMWLNKFEYVTNMMEVPHKNMGELFIRMLIVDVGKSTRDHSKFVNTFKHSYDQVLSYYGYLFLDIPEFQFHRIRFTCREQYEQEPIAKYANNLKKIFYKCNYEMYEEIRLCQQFLNGIRDDDIRTYLNNSPGISFFEIVGKAITFAKANNITHYLNMAFSMINMFNSEKEGKFYEWLNRFEYVANMIEVPDDRMVEFFNKMVDNCIHTSVQKTCPSVNFSEFSYEELVNHYLRYFSPCYDGNLNIRRFQCRNQYEQESIKMYTVNLCKLYNKCSSNDNSEKILCEQFIKGIRNNDMRTHLSETLSLPFNKTLEKVIAFLEDNQTAYYFDQLYSIINVFERDKEGPFLTWLIKFESVANMIAVPYEIVGELFITMLHDDVHKFINNNSETDNCFEHSYEQILDKYRYLSFGTEKLKFYRSRFTNRKQYALESIPNYAENLRRICSKCYYSSYVDMKISKQFINGLRDEEIRTFLRTISCKSFDNIVETAIEFKKTNVASRYVIPAFTMINMFNPEEEDRFYEWFNKFEYVADMVAVPDDKMIEFFEAMVDNDVHKSVRKRFSSVNFFELIYRQLTNHYLRYHSPSDERDLHKKCFTCRNQYEKETIQKYADKLKKIFNKCNYTDHLEEKLCETFLNGIRDDDIRSHLTKFQGLSFHEIVEKAIAFEKANDITHYLDPALSMINIYNPEKEGKFYEWLNKFEFVADYVGVPSNIMVQFLKKMVDYNVHIGVKKMFPCVTYSSLSYEAIINLYLRYFSFSCEFHFNRKRFLSRKRYENERIDKFAESLYDLYDKYIEKSRMEEELREQFLAGIRDYDLRTHLNKTPHLSFYETVKEAIAFEKANDIYEFLNKALTKINIFDLTKGYIFFEWLNRFEYVADMIGLPEIRMNKLFDKMVDNNSHTSVKKANPSVEFSELSYEEKIIIYLRYFHFGYENNIYKKRFFSRKQYEDETIEKYASNLQRINDKCNYENNIQEKLCAQFLCGILNDDIKTLLLINKTSRTSFDELVAKAIAIEKEIHISNSKEE